MTKFSQVPRKYWDDRSNQRAFLDDIAKQLDINDVHGWYKLTTTSLRKLGGSSLLCKYNFSLAKLLSTVYPEYPYFLCIISLFGYKWNLACFSQVPREYWDKIPNQRAFMDDLAKQLNITDQEGWFNVTTNTLKQHRGTSLLHKYHDSVTKLISSVYPEYLVIFYK